MSGGVVVAGVLIFCLGGGIGSCIARGQAEHEPPETIVKTQTQLRTVTVMPSTPAPIVKPLPAACLEAVDLTIQIVNNGELLSRKSGNLHLLMQQLTPSIALGGDIAEFNKAVEQITALDNGISNVAISNIQVHDQLSAKLDTCKKEIK